MIDLDSIRIEKGTENERKRMAGMLYGVDLVSEDIRENIITAWITAVKNSAYESLDMVPYSLLAPEYRLIDHVNEVTRMGISMSGFATEYWDESIDLSELVPILVLHDVDKPLLSNMQSEKMVPSDLYGKVLHGVLGSYILKELGFSEKVVFAVSTHAARSPIHGEDLENMILHYADFFSADHAILKNGGRAFFQKHYCD